MRRLSVTIFTLALCLSAGDQPGGWILLFDGKSMAGWDDPRQKTPPGDAWTIEDGCLKAIAHPRIVEDLFTLAAFRDFELAWEWRISRAGNSGVKYRIQKHLFVAPPDAGAPMAPFAAQVERSFDHPVLERPAKGQDYVIGFEYQMTDDAENPDALAHRKHTAGALYDMVAASQAAARPVGEFNQSRIVLRDNRVQHWMNGVKVVDSALDSPEALAGIESRWGRDTRVYNLLAHQPLKDAHISLQNHGDNAWFRNIRIRKLD